MTLLEITTRVLDALGVGSALMVGHSMGGAMVAEFAATHPERVTAAVLVDAAAGEDHHDAIRVYASPTAALRAFQFFTGVLADVVGDGIRVRRMRPFKERVHFYRLREPVRIMDIVRATHALMRHDTGPLLKKMRDNAVPTVVVHGTRDGIIPILAALSAAQLTRGNVVPGSGRLPLVDAQRGETRGERACACIVGRCSSGDGDGGVSGGILRWQRCCCKSKAHRIFRAATRLWAPANCGSLAHTPWMRHRNFLSGVSVDIEISCLGMKFVSRRQPRIPIKGAA
jgi:hypothetical protein